MDLFCRDSSEELELTPLYEIVVPPPSIVLRTSADWVQWLATITRYAKSLQLWEYVDPKATTPFPLEPTVVTYDQAFAANGNKRLNEEELKILSFRREDQKLARRKYYRLFRARNELASIIFSSIEQSLNMYLGPTIDPREMILKLEKLFVFPVAAYK